MKAKFFPKEQFPISICKHRFGSDVTITEQTDTLQLQVRYPIEYYGYKYNIRTGAYLGLHYTDDSIDISSVNKIGNIRSDIYLNIGAVAPTYEEAISLITPWFEEMTDRMPSGVSFAGGNQGLAVFTINDFLGGRNSETGESQYGNYTRLEYSNIASTTRWFDDGLTWTQVSDILSGVILTSGWFRNFTHWHNLSSNSVVYKQGEFYQTMLDTLQQDNKQANFCSAGEALEYLVYSQLITRLACYESVNGNVRIALEVDNLFLQDRLNTPISVEVDLTGSSLENKNIASINCEIQSLGNNKYIVNVPFRIDDATNKIILVELFEGDQVYRTNDKPTAVISTTGNVLTVNTEAETLATLFVKLKTEAEDKYTLYSRSIFWENAHEFSNLDFINSDYAVGISNKFQVMNLINI